VPVGGVKSSIYNINDGIATAHKINPMQVWSLQELSKKLFFSKKTAKN